MLKGKIAIVTGASSGIGRAAAVRLCREGVAGIVINGRNSDALDTLGSQIQADSAICPKPRVVPVVGDVTCEETCGKVVDAAIESCGKLDILVNSAGMLASGPVETTGIEVYDRMMNVNVRSLIRVTQLAIPHLRKTKGNIVNVSSVTGMRSFPGVSYYCMSKAATDMFTQCLALELAESGVRVNAVNPGVIVTALHKSAGMDDEAYSAFLQKAKTTHPIGRPGNAEEVAAAIVFLASEQASFCTGNLTPVDGGRHATCFR